MSWKLSGQSISISGKVIPANDSLSAVRTYVSNAKAVLDSLNSYEFLKVRAGQLRSDLQTSQAEKLGLKLQTIRLRVSLDSCNRANQTAEKKDGKLKAARAENWVWRGLGLLALLEVTAQLLSVFK